MRVDCYWISFVWNWRIFSLQFLQFLPLILSILSLGLFRWTARWICEYFFHFLKKLSHLWASVLLHIDFILINSVIFAFLSHNLCFRDEPLGGVESGSAELKKNLNITTEQLEKVPPFDDGTLTLINLVRRASGLLPLTDDGEVAAKVGSGAKDDDVVSGGKVEQKRGTFANFSAIYLLSFKSDLLRYCWIIALSRRLLRYGGGEKWMTNLPLRGGGGVGGRTTM